MRPQTKTYRGQKYECTEVAQIERLDGTPVSIETWRSYCPECGAPFSFRRPTTARKWAPNRRCEKHKRPGRKVAPKRTKSRG